MSRLSALDPRSVQHVVFDFDGVLCNSLAICVEEYEGLRLTKFRALPVVTVDSRMDEAFSGLLSRSLDRWLDSESASSFFDSHSAAMASRSSELMAFEGILDLLDQLPPQSA